MSKRRDKTWKSHFSVTLPLLISAFIFVLPLQANAYSINGNVRASTGYGGDSTNRSTDAGAATSLSDSASSQTGFVSATPSYFADLSTGLLGTYVAGSNPIADVYGSGGANAQSTVSFNESLTFTLDAGTYATDQYVYADGFVNGVLSAFGCDGRGRCSNVFEIWTFGFGGDSYGVQSNETTTYPNG